VPKLEGLTEAAATSALTQAGLTAGDETTAHSVSVPAGSVISASQDQGTELDENAKVDLVVSDGKVDLPDLTGRTISDARSTLDDLGLTADVVPVTDCTAIPDTVSYQVTGAGSVAQGSKVTLQQCTAAAATPTPTATVTPPVAG
jgi:eukaryotic-like serine/threonine-protein kinase